MQCTHDDGGVHGLGEGISEETQQVCPLKYASVVGVQLDVHDFLVMGACDGDCGGDPYFDLCFDGGQHCICLGVSQADDKVGELRECVFAEMRDDVGSVRCG